MSHLNAEIKAKTQRLNEIRDVLISNGAISKGIDHQIDTYFKVEFGRLKLRQGNIENSLIWYCRNNQPDIKQSDISLFPIPSDSSELKAILDKILPTLTQVDKHREILFIDNVKFHLDTVEHLGTFVEIEAIGTAGQDFESLRQQCSFYKDLLHISDTDLVSNSYSDMLLSESYA